MPEPGPGQALTRTIYISLDPYQWGYKRRGVEPKGAPCHARTVSQVVESRMDGYAPGDLVFNTSGWTEYGLMGEGVWRPDYMVPRKLDPAALGRISYAVGVLGMLGLTAYAGMIVQCDPKPGETVVVSAATGGVGQIAVQLARERGCNVVGIASTGPKCIYLAQALRVASVSHLPEDFPQTLKEVCANGIDVYFENVGGKVFDAVLPLFNPGARMTICGLIAHYGDTGDARAALMAKGEAIFRERDVRVQDLFVGNYVNTHYDAMLAELGPLVRSGRIQYREDIRQGLENVPAAFAEMLKGGNFGKMLVQVGEDPTL